MLLSTLFKVKSIAQVISNNDLPYSSSTLNNDWSILKLASPLEMNSDVQAACLPSSAGYLSISSTEERCFTSGWGTLSQGILYRVFHHKEPQVILQF